MNNILRNRFPDFAPLKTFAGAQARIDRYLSDRGIAKSAILFVVVQVDDGFIPLAFVGPNHFWVAREIVDHGICVTNH